MFNIAISMTKHRRVIANKDATIAELNNQIKQLKSQQSLGWAASVIGRVEEERNLLRSSIFWLFKMNGWPHGGIADYPGNMTDWLVGIYKASQKREGGK